MNRLDIKSQFCNKIISLIIVFLLLFSEVGFALKYGISYASSNQNVSKYVDFNASFIGDAHDIVYKLDSDDAKLYISISPKENGYLKNGVISFENENFEILSDKVENENVEKIENNTITLKHINNGDYVTIELPIKIKKSELINIETFSKVFNTKFNGVFVDNQAKENEVSCVVENKLNWTADASINTTFSIQKYVPFNSNDNYGVLLQIKANSKVEKNILPVKNTNLKIQSPEPNGMKPSKVKVISNRTTATNGKTDGLEFNEEKWDYDNETGITEINVENVKNENNEVSWIQNVDDEYLISFIYEGKEIYDYIQEHGFNAQLKGTTNISVYGSTEMNLEEQVIDNTIELNEKVSDIINFNVTAEEDKISKGQIYSNYDAKDKKEIEYNLKYIADVAYAQIFDYIEFEQKSYDEFITKEGNIALTTIGDNNYTRNKSINVSVPIFNKILGEDGYIEVFDEQNNKIGTINKETEIENNSYVLDILSLNNNKLKLRTSKPITEGQLIVNIKKTIGTKVDYSKEQVETFTSLKSTLSGQTELVNIDTFATIPLAEPISSAEIKFDSDGQAEELSTTQTYSNLEMRIVLDTSDTANALFKNPSFEIKFPKVIENINVNDIKLVNENNLKISEKVIQKSDDGCIVLKIKLAGTQTDYNVGYALKGTNIIINYGLEINKLATSSKEKIVLTYTNENSNLYKQTDSQGNGIASTQINIVAPSGVIAASEISNYKQDAQEIFSILDETKTVEIDAYTEKRIATIKGTVINNYQNEINNISVLGRLPVQGNKKIDTDTEMGSTYTIPLSTGITISGISQSDYTIYYSENTNATKEINDQNNGWSTQATTTSKSFLIVFNSNYKMTSGEKFEFSYNIEIPEGLTPNNSAYSMYKVYYTSNSDIGTMDESKNSAIIEFKTPKGPEAEITLSSATEVVREEQIVEITVTVKNIGDTKIEKGNLKIIAPEGTVHTEIKEGTKSYTDSEDKEKIIYLGDIEAGKSIIKRYELRIEKGKKTSIIHNDDGDIVVVEDKYPGDKDVENSVSLLASNINGEIKSETFTFTVLEGDLKITNIPDTYPGETLRKGKIIKYMTSIENISNDKNLSNVTLNVNLPEGLKIRDAYYSDQPTFEEKNKDTVNINGNNISINVGDLDSIKAYINNNPGNEGEGNEEDGPLDISLRTITYVYIEFEVEEFTGELTTIMNASADEIDDQYSNVIRFNAEKVELSITQSELQKQYIKETEEYSYNFTIKNNGKTSSISNKMEMDIPEGLSFVEATYTYKGEEKVLTRISNGKLTINLPDLISGEKVNIEIKVKANLLPNKNDKEITTFATLQAAGFTKITSNKVSVIIEYNPNVDHDGGNEPSGTGRYKLTGTAWVDSNQDGQRDSSEQTVAGMQVMLLNKEDYTVVKDVDTGKEKITITSSNGAYQFDNLPNGEYVVVFIYDSSNYSLTEYQKQGVNNRYNSDAIDVNFILNGERIIAGITDILTINGENVRDIDIGMYKADKFDLRLDKYVSKIKLTTPTIGTKEYNYNNSELAKIEVLGQNLGKSSAVIEYKIIVTNEGSVPGYVSKIVDYLPEKVDFNTELNTQWYLSKNGNIYNASLANELINPGESKEVDLIVSIKVSENTLGLLENSAEIYESYNEQGLKDIDSSSNNEMAEEDDMSKAEVIISIVTGKLIAYTLITLIVITLLGIGVYQIKKHVLKRK